MRVGNGNRFLEWFDFLGEYRLRKWSGDVVETRRGRNPEGPGRTRPNKINPPKQNKIGTHACPGGRWERVAQGVIDFIRNRRAARRAARHAPAVLTLSLCVGVFVFRARLALVSRRHGGEDLGEEQQKGEE